MENSKDFTVSQLQEKHAKYRAEKRLQVFLRTKCRHNFGRMQTAVRKLKLGVQPTPQERSFLQVSIEPY